MSAYVHSMSLNLSIVYYLEKIFSHCCPYELVGQMEIGKFLEIWSTIPICHVFGKNRTIFVCHCRGFLSGLFQFFRFLWQNLSKKPFSQSLRVNCLFHDFFPLKYTTPCSQLGVTFNSIYLRMIRSICLIIINAVFMKRINFIFEIGFI